MDLSTRKLCYTYEEGFTIKDICLDARSGRVLGIIGPNGSGKSTLIQCIVGLRRPKSGVIQIGERDSGSMTRREVAQRIGYVPQDHPPAFPFRVLDVVLMGRTPHLGIFESPSRGDEALARETLAELGISHLTERPYTHISGGERRLVMIARALAQQAEIIILDEPTAYLDFRNHYRVMETISGLASAGATVVMSLHDPAEALECCHDALLLSDGAAVASGLSADAVTEENLSHAYGVPITRADAPRFLVKMRRPFDAALRPCSGP